MSKEKSQEYQKVSIYMYVITRPVYVAYIKVYTYEIRPFFACALHNILYCIAAFFVRISV